MAKKRKFVAYRNLERPYTRWSKFKRASFVKTRPNCRVVRFDMGVDRDYAYKCRLIAKADLQIRDNAIESARMSANRWLEKKVGKGNFKFKIRIAPHHLLRENPLASGAGADRMSTGMAHSFGKIVGRAAQIRKGQTLMEVGVEEQHLEHARTSLKRASHKVPCTCGVVVDKLTVQKSAKAVA